MINLFKPVLSYFLVNTSRYQTQLADSDKNDLSLKYSIKNDDFFNFLPHLNRSYIDGFNSVSKTPLTDFITPNCYKNFTPSTDMSNLAAFSSKSLISFNCEPSQSPYLRKVKFESTQDPNTILLEFACVDEFSDNIPTVQGASFYSLLGTVEVLFYTLMLIYFLRHFNLMPIPALDNHSIEESTDKFHTDNHSRSERNYFYYKPI